MVESGYEGLAGIIVVDVDPELAVERLITHRGFTETDARERIARQASRTDRLARADVGGDNRGSLEDLVAQGDRVQVWLDALDRPPLDQPVNRIGSHSESD